ncbi:MAG: hypothetical protein ACTSRP_24865, partial [Candidatus Helarchaeota archaeon]
MKKDYFKESSNLKDSSEKRINKYSIFSSIIVGYLFSISIFFGMVTFRWIQLTLFGIPIDIMLFLMGFSAIMFLTSIFLDRYNKEIWLKLFFPSTLIFAIGIIIFVFTRNFIGIYMMALFIFPATVISVIFLSFNGYYYDVFNRGKHNSVTVFFVFGFVALASLFVYLNKDLYIGAGLIFYAITGIILGIYS